MRDIYEALFAFSLCLRLKTIIYYFIMIKDTELTVYLTAAPSTYRRRDSNTSARLPQIICNKS